MLDRYMALNERGKTLFWLVAIAVLGFFCLSPLFFLYSIRGFSYPLGWLIGSLAGILSYLSISKQGNALSPSSSGSVLLVIGLMALRILLSAAVLVVSAICTFKSDLWGGFDAFSFYTAAAAVVLMPIVVLIVAKLKKRGETHRSEELR